MPSAQIRGYTPIGFNTLPILRDHAEIHLSADVLAELGSIVRKYGMETEYGITRIHRHFELKPDEILVRSSSPDGNVSILSPWVVQGGVAMPSNASLLEPANMKIQPYILPLTWMFSDGDAVAPYEYANTATAVDDQGPPFAPGFLPELHAFLDTLGWVHEVGIARLKKDVKGHGHGLETTDKATRCSTTTYVASKEEAALAGGVQVAWDFSGEERSGSCSCSCTSYNC